MAAADLATRVQRRTLSVLLCTQIVGGVGVAIGFSVGALLAATMGGTQVSGLASSAAVVGGALLAIPVTRLMRWRGRRAGLVLGYAVGALGSAGTVWAAAVGSVPALLAGMLLFGGGTTANLQARYTAVDLAPAPRRGRHLSLVVWATTIGAVAGPNLAEFSDERLRLLAPTRYSGPFVLSAVAFVLAGAVIFVAMRPDPLLTARAIEPAPGSPSGDVPTAQPPAPQRLGLRAAAREVVASPLARLGLAAVAVGQVVMVGIMSMTSVHIGESGYTDVLHVVGIVLSVHIAGMYMLSPVMGWLADRLGRRAVILLAVATLLSACAIAGTAGHDLTRLSVGLALVGLGWSAAMVAGSTLLTESVGLANRPTVQGLSDFVTGSAGAVSGALSGVILTWSSYPALVALAAVVTLPLLALALRTRMPAVAPPVGPPGATPVPGAGAGLATERA